MALNSITLNYNNIKEIEENESIPPPRITFSGQNKTISAKLYNRNILNNKYDINMNISNRKTKSFCSYFNVYKLYDNFFTENFVTKNNINNESRNKNINKDYIKNLKEYKSTKRTKISKSISIRTKNNILFSNTDKIVDINNSSEEQFDNNKNNLYRRINNKRIIKKFPNDTNKIIKKKLPYLNLEQDNDKPRIKINESLSLRKITTERNIINNISTDFLNNDNTNGINNLLSKLKNVPYIRKKVKNIKKINGENKTQSISLKSFSIHSEKNIKEKKFSSKKNDNKKKLLDFSNFIKIQKSNAILHILRFLDYSDIINIFNTRNKKKLLLINKSLIKSYYFKIKKELRQYNYLFDLIQCYIFRSRIKDALKIDLIANIRFKYQENNNILQPLYIKLAYAYNYFKKIKPNKELITKEDYEFQKSTKIEKVCDYYSFDFYPKNERNNGNNNKNNKIYISKELPIQGKNSNNIATVQSILPFTEQDQGFINLEIYNAEKGFVNFNEIKLSIKIYNLKTYLKHLAKKEINNIRISEYEELCYYWKNINLYEYKELIIKMMKTYFGNFFDIKKIFYDNIGIYIFKVELKAIKSGDIKNKKNVGINIKINEQNDIIKNEIRKNNLLFEKRDIVEIRIGDEITYYFCLK